MPDQATLEKFVTKSPNKTPPMTVTITAKGEFITTFEAPAGFQLERFAATHFPGDERMVVYFEDNPERMIVEASSIRSPQYQLDFVGVYKEKT
jgi:hypothetical protein